MRKKHLMINSQVLLCRKASHAHAWSEEISADKLMSERERIADDGRAKLRRIKLTLIFIKEKVSMVDGRNPAPVHTYTYIYMYETLVQMAYSSY